MEPWKQYQQQQDIKEQEKAKQEPTSAAPWMQYQQQPEQPAPAEQSNNAAPWTQYQTTPAAPEKPSSYERATSIRRTDKGGAIASEKITQEELEEIARQTGTDAQKLKEFVPYFGVFNQGDESIGSALKAAAGQAGKMAFGVPQKLLKMAQDDKYEEALDILGSLAGQKQSYFLDVAGILGGPGTAAIKAGKEISAAQKLGTVAKEVGKGATLGAAAGAAQADKDEELKGAATGAAVGGAIAAPLVTYKVMKNASKWSDNKIRQGIENIQKNSANIEDAYAAQRPARALEIEAIKEAAPAYRKDFSQFNISDETANRFISEEARTAALTEGTAENKLLSQFLNTKMGKVAGEGVRESADRSPEEINKALSYLKLRSINDDLKRTYGSTLDELSSRGSSEVSRLVDELDKTNFALQAVRGKGFEKRLNPFERIGYNIMKYTSDSKPFLQVLDDRYGTNWELIADNASKKMNLVYGAGIRKWAPQINEIAQAAKDPALFNKVVQEVESGVPVSKEAKYLADFFEQVRQDANSQGANIQKLSGAGYFPKLRKSPAEYIRSYRQEADKLQQTIDFSELTDESMKKLMKVNPEFRDFAEETLRMGDMSFSADNFKQAYSVLNNDISKARQALNMKSFAQMQRSDANLPMWARELDPAKAASRWVTNTYKYLALKDELTQLKSAEEIARKAKDTVAADYLKNLREDWMGGRINTVASWGKKQSEKWSIRMDQLKDQAIKDGQANKAWFYDGLKDLPDFLTKAQNTLYVNAMGLSPKAAAQNLASFYIQNFPELGHTDAIKYSMSALPKLGQLVRKGQMAEYVYQKGLIDRDWTGEAVNVLSNNLRQSLARRVGKKAAEKYSQAAMAAFKISEITARAMSSLMAEGIGKDVLKNPELRNKLLLNMKSGAYKRQLQNALEKRDEKQIVDVLTHYMNSNNMYNYQKLNQAEFARSLGPLVSMFSKWPTMAIGSVGKELLSGSGLTPAVAKNMRLLYAPLMTLYIADKVSDQTLKPAVGEQRYESVLGKKGLTGMNVVSAVPTDVFNKEGLLDKPVVRAAKAAGQFAADVVNTDTPFGKDFSKAYKEIAPIYVPVLPLIDKVMTREVPRLIYNEKPKKDK